jgi:hypothetical protein
MAINVGRAREFNHPKGENVIHIAGM